MWLRELQEASIEEPVPTDIEGLTRENTRLRRELEETRMEREILEKATIFFAQKHP